MKISDLLKLSTDNLRRRKGRTALTVIGVVVGTCAIVVMISLGIATNRRTDEMLSTWSDLTQIQVFSYSENPDTPALDDKMVAQFKEMENVVAATPLYNFQSMNANVVAGKKRPLFHVYVQRCGHGCRCDRADGDRACQRQLSDRPVAGTQQDSRAGGRGHSLSVRGYEKKVTAIRTVTAGRKQMKTETSSSSRFLISRKRRSPCR